MSMKNSGDTIGNRTRDLPACSAVTQPTALWDKESYQIHKGLPVSDFSFKPVYHVIWLRKYDNDSVYDDDDDDDDDGDHTRMVRSSEYIYEYILYILKIM